MRPVQPFIQCKNVFGWVRAAATKESINENIQQKYILYSNSFRNQTSFASHILQVKIQIISHECSSLFITLQTIINSHSVLWINQCLQYIAWLFLMFPLTARDQLKQNYIGENVMGSICTYSSCLRQNGICKIELKNQILPKM